MEMATKNFEAKVDVRKETLRLREQNDNECASFNYFTFHLQLSCGNSPHAEACLGWTLHTTYK